MKPTLPNPRLELAPDLVDELGRRLSAHSGLDLPRWVLEARASARMAALGVDGPRYLALVRGERAASELAALVEAVRVGETRLFRHQPQFDALAGVVVPAWRARGVTRPRVLSAGCASGEEAYSLAATIALAPGVPALRPSVLGVDVSQGALEQARRALFAPDAERHIPAAYRGAFDVGADGVRPRPEIAGLVRFAEKNLHQGGGLGRFDLIFCRNVLIYFDEEAKREVLDTLVAALDPEGYLFVGYSETLRNVPGLVQEGAGDRAVWIKRATPAAARSSRGERASVTELDRASSPDLGRASAPDLGRASSPDLGALPPRPRAPAPALAIAPTPAETPRLERVREIRPAGADAATLTAAIRGALEEPGVAALTVDLDAAGPLGDDAAPVLRRALAAARSLGIALTLRTRNEGARRFLRRHGLSGGPT